MSVVFADRARCVVLPWACFALLYSPDARADDESDEATVRAHAAPAATTVLGHAEIERTGGVTLADALRPQADVDLPGGGAAGATGRLSLRGASPEETLIAVDGLRVSQRSSVALVAGIDPNLLPVSLLQRVTIYRGPLSALWGPNAVAGVVELTSREPTTPRTLSGTLQYAAYLSGEHEPAPVAPPPMDDDDVFEGGPRPFYGARGQLTGALRERERFVVAGLSAGYSGGWAPNTSSRLIDAAIKAGRTYPGGGTGYVLLRAYDAYSGVPPWGTLLSSDAFDADDRQARQGMQAAAVLRRALGGNASVEASVSLGVSRATLYNPDGDVTAGSSAAQSLQRSTEAQGRVAWTRDAFGPLGAVTLGADFGYEALEADTFAPAQATRGSFFVRDQRPFGPVTLDLAARIDLDSLYGVFVSPRAALHLRGDLARGELSLGRAFRPPTFAERGWPTFIYATPTHGAVGERGNPDAQAERAWGADVSVSLGGGPRPWLATLRAFGLYTEDFLRWAVDRDAYWTPRNAGDVWSTGASFEASARLLRRLSLIGSAFWQTTRDATSGDELTGRLRAKASARVVWYARRGLRAWAEAVWFDRSGVDARGEAWRGFFVNARVGWQFTSGVGAFALGENLLDTRFETLRGLPTPGRVVWIGLAVDVDED